MLQSRLKNIVLEVFKSLKCTNPAYIQDIFEIKDQPHDLRNEIPLIQTKKNTTNFGLRTFGYLGSKMWNDLPAHLQDISDQVDVDIYKSLLKDWPGPNYDTAENPFL